MENELKNNRLYKFRPIKSIFDYKELEDEYIYFASQEELNDPMEGFINFYWKGDSVVWENLLKHYIFSFALCFESYYFTNSEINFDKDFIPIFFDEHKFEKVPFGSFLKDIANAFLNDAEILDFLEFIKVYNRKVFKDELYFYLKTLTSTALFYVVDFFHKRYGSFSIKKMPYEGLFKKLTDLYKPLINEHGKRKTTELFDILAPFLKQEMDLFNISFKQEYERKMDKNDFEVKTFFFSYFPAFYVDRIREIAFPKLYCSCFMSSYENIANWGYYADSNKGCCLIFEPEIKDGYFCLNLRSKNLKESLESCKVHKISYSKKIPGIDFFSHLGNLQNNAKEIESSWYINGQGEHSKTHKMPESQAEETEWKQEYNELLEKLATSKLPAWKNENEYRIFLHDGFECSSDKESRKFCYPFEILKGIAFGINTSESDKVKIINLMTKKCNDYGRKDFKFYQANVNKENGKIELADLMIKVD